MSDKKNIFSTFTNSLIELPLWIKQILYLDLRQNIDSYLTDDLNFSNKKDILQFYVPELSFMGKDELTKRERGFELNVYKFLESASMNSSIIEMAINNYWTLEECSRYFMVCIQNEFLQEVNSPVVEATAGFICGEIRIGEYFKKINKINADQLNEVLKTQKNIEESTGDKVGIASIMINMNLITEKDTKALLHIKDEARKRFVLDYNMSHFADEPVKIVKPQPARPAVKQIITPEELEKLKQENKVLKEQLFKILKIKK